MNAAVPLHKIARDPLPEKTIFDVLRDIWKARYYMLGCTVLALICALTYTKLCIPHYRAQMLIAPSILQEGQNITAETQIPEGTISVQHTPLLQTWDFQRFEYSLTGPSVAKILLDDAETLQKILYTDHDFIYDRTARSNALENPENLSDYLKRRIRMDTISGTNIRRISYAHADPALAREMIEKLHRIADNLIRISALSATKGRIAHLQNAMNDSTQPEQKNILSNLLIGLERERLFATIGPDYAAQVIEPPYASPRPVWPDPYLVYPLFLLGGLITGFVMYGLRHNE